MKTSLTLTNSVGVIDSGYRGEVTAVFRNMMEWSPEVGVIYPVGKGSHCKPIAQMVILPYPTVELEEVSELSETTRGANGYGSTDKLERNA
jgi:dUTP pyrophosphatase